MEVQPYVQLHGRCDEAIEFYREVLGAEVVLKMRFRDAPPDVNRPIPPELADRIMHATLLIGTSQLFLSDGDGQTDTHTGFGLSLSVGDLQSGERCFNALAQGGRVGLPFQPTFWSPGFGVVVDRFGVPWMVNVAHPEHPGQ